MADPTVVDLFGEDAQLIDGRAIPELVAVAESGVRVFAELEITIAGGSVLHVVDVFVVRDSVIESLTYYLADDGS